MKGLIISVCLMLSLTAFSQSRTDLCCKHYQKIDSLQQVEIELLETKHVIQDSIIFDQQKRVQVTKKTNRISTIGLTGIIFILLIL